LNTFAFIGVYLRLNPLPAALARFFSSGHSLPLPIPAGAANLATELFDSTGRRRSLGLRASWPD